MEFLHTMIKVADLDKSLEFYQKTMGMTEVRRMEIEEDRFTVVFLAATRDLDVAKSDRFGPTLELMSYWDEDKRINEAKQPWGHLAYRVDNIYDTCKQLMDAGITINRPPRDGFKAFFKTPEGVTVELIQRRPALPPQEPWTSMLDTGTFA